MDLTSGCICDFECIIVDKLVNGAFARSTMMGRQWRHRCDPDSFLSSHVRFILYSEDVGACLDPKPWQDVQIQAWTVCVNE